MAVASAVFADTQGNVIQRGVVKLGPISKIIDEENRYDKFANEAIIRSHTPEDCVCRGGE